MVIKDFLIISLIVFLSLSCERNDNNENLICGVKKPLEELEWLKELVQKAETDTTGHYKGTIYLEKIGNEDAFFVEMSMGSGGIKGAFYNCDDIVPKRDSILYRNIP